QIQMHVKKALLNAPSPPRLSVKSIRTGDDLLETIQEYEQYAKQISTDFSTHSDVSLTILNEFIPQLFQLVQNDPPTPESTELIQSLQQNPKLCEKLVEQMTKLSEVLFEQNVKVGLCKIDSTISL